MSGLSERDKKRQQEQHERVLAEMLTDSSNALCADCGARGPRWASWNIGVFLCVRCCGLHRKLGTHITRIKSTTLDSWTSEQIESIRQWGNSKANALYNPNHIAVSKNASDREMEQYIRDKYERKAFMTSSSRASHGGNSTSQGSTASSQGSASATRYALEQSKLRDMGFTYDEWNVKALEQTSGNIQAAVDKLVAMGPPPQSATPASRQPSAHQSSESRMAGRDTKVVVDKNSPQLRELKNMGFMDDTLNIAALQKAEGSIDTAISYLTDRRHELQVTTPATRGSVRFGDENFNQQQKQQPQQSQIQQQPPPVANNPLVDLLGDVGDAFAPPLPQRQQQQQSMFANDPFGGSSLQHQQYQQQQQQQSQPFGMNQTGLMGNGAAGPFGQPNTSNAMGGGGGANLFGASASPQLRGQQNVGFGVGEVEDRSKQVKDNILSLYSHQTNGQQQQQSGFMGGGGNNVFNMGQQQKQPMQGQGMYVQSSAMGMGAGGNNPVLRSFATGGNSFAMPMQQPNMTGMSNNSYTSSNSGGGSVPFNMTGGQTSTPFGNVNSNNNYTTPFNTIMQPKTGNNPFNMQSQQNPATGQFGMQQQQPANGLPVGGVDPFLGLMGGGIGAMGSNTDGFGQPQRPQQQQQSLQQPPQYQQQQNPFF